MEMEHLIAGEIVRLLERVLSLYLFTQLISVHDLLERPVVY